MRKMKMPKINIEVNTDDETMVIKIGEEVVEGANYVTLASPDSNGYYDKMYVYITKTEKSEEGIVKYTSYSLASSKNKDLATVASKSYKGFLESVSQNSPIVERLGDFVSSRLKDRAKRRH
jgi:hypothetical protein